MTYVRLSSGTVHLRDGDTTACGRSVADASPAGQSGKVGMCSTCLRVQSIRGTLTDAWKGNKQVNRMALIRELVDLRNKRG